MLSSHEFNVKKCILALKKINLISVYNLLINIAGFFVKFIALFNEKIKLGVTGRKTTFEKLTNTIGKDDSTIWFHCASLGEYEQGLPVFEEVKKNYPKHKIVLSFFSPSGFEIRKDSPISDIVVYLPLDTKKNVERFLNLINPDLIIFVKYEIWPNYLSEIKKRNIKTILISALFRPNQIYFKPYGKWIQKYLNAFSHFFVQNANSKQLLNSIGFKNVTISGDTRFDRVSNQLKINNTLSYIDEFTNNKLCFVAGSTWPDGEDYICNYINSNQSSDVKFIIAPHDIKSNRINSILKKLKVPSVLFSEKEHKELNNFNVFIIDTIGVLSKIYSYADIAYVGGAVGTTGLHNILEPAVYGIPIIIGMNHIKFPEAKLMIDHGGVFSIKNENEFESAIHSFKNDSELRKKAGDLNDKFINNNKGAVVQIVDYIRR